MLVFNANENAHESVSSSIPMSDSDDPGCPMPTVGSARREIRVCQVCAPRSPQRVTAAGEAPYIIRMRVRRHNRDPFR
jgi:hypothetical protein